MKKKYNFINFIENLFKSTFKDLFYRIGKHTTKRAKFKMNKRCTFIYLFTNKYTYFKLYTFYLPSMINLRVMKIFVFEFYSMPRNFGNYTSPVSLGNSENFQDDVLLPLNYLIDIHC